MGSKPAPLLVLARCGRLQKSQEHKTKEKNQLHRFLYKTRFTILEFGRRRGPGAVKFLPRARRATASCS